MHFVYVSNARLIKCAKLVLTISQIIVFYKRGMSNNVATVFLVF